MSLSFTVAQQHERMHKWDRRFLSLCRYISTWSKDPSTKCGAVIVRDRNRIVSAGYNGYPAGVPDDHTLQTRKEKYQRIIHAEVNAILMAKQDLKGYTIYVYPLLPCAQCAAAIIQSGIARVVSVIPKDPETRERWKISNDVALTMFHSSLLEVSIIEYAHVFRTEASNVG